MPAELKSLRIDKSQRRADEASPWATRWIIGGVLVFLMLGAGRYVYSWLNASMDVETMIVQAAASRGAGGSQNDVILNATGYIVAAHKIQVASKVLGRVAWIGVDKGYNVKEGQVIVRLEDDEYKAQLQQAKGQLQNLDARLDELKNGSRPEEIQVAKANVDVAKADQANAKLTLDRTRKLVEEGVLARQQLDDAVAKYDSAAARVSSLDRTWELVRIGPRKEQIDAVLGQIEQARGSVAFYQTQLNNTVIKAPVTGTILERAVEKGEFVTTSFVGERGAKGYVVSLADLNDLQVELDISQNDFRKLDRQQKGAISTDAFPDRKYEGMITEISPEANRQKATVQVKVKVLKPDDFLRPEMNASVAFYNDAKSTAASAAAPAKPMIFVPPGAVKGDVAYILYKGKAMRKAVKTGPSTSQGVRVEDGLIGGEELILNPPVELKDGMKVKKK